MEKPTEKRAKECKIIEGGKPSHWFVYTDWEIKRNFIKPDEDIKYHCRGYEICPDTKKAHWQGVINTWKKIRPSALRKKFAEEDPERDPPYYLEPSFAKDSRECVAYAKKCGNKYGYDVEEDGTFVSEAGQRTDIEDAVNYLKISGWDKNFARSHSEAFVKYHKGFSALWNEIQPERDFMPNAHYISGPTGIGKSSSIYKHFEKKFGKGSIYIMSDLTGKWWDGYRGQPVVIVNEFQHDEKTDWNTKNILNLLDRYPHQVQVKNGWTPFLAKYIIFSSNFSYDDNFKNVATEHQKAIFRRFCKIVSYSLPVGSKKGTWVFYPYNDELGNKLYKDKEEYQDEVTDRMPYPVGK